MRSNLPFIIITAILLLLQNNLNAQSLQLDWKIETGKKIVAPPALDDEHVFIGNESGTFFAIDQHSGEILWQVETGGNIQGRAVLNDEHIFFESANTFYALNKTDGKEIWQYTLNMSPEKFSYADKDFLFKLDFFDDKRSSGIIHKGIFYAGTSNGKVIGLNSKTGELEFSINSNNNSPVRSTPLIHEDQLFFGDWNGIVYCFDLNSNSFLWQKSTYREKPYDTFGGIASEFLVYKGKLFFGARNPMFNVLWKDDGQKEWTYTDPDGGWLIGDPVIYSDTLYVGGSDNFAMLALSPSDGRLLWKNQRSKNIYVKPIVSKEYIIYPGGNSYDPRDTGEIVILDRFTGETITSFETPYGVFSAPAWTEEGQIIFGSLDGAIYSLKLESL